MPRTDQDRIIALAGLHQAAFCVQRIARRGQVEVEAMEPCIFSLFQIDAADVPSVYGPAGAVATGARQIVAQVTGQPARDLELTRYLVVLLKHERILATHPELLRKIGTGIEIAAAKRQQRSLLDGELLACLAGVYSDHVSQLEPRIMVHGNTSYLKQTENVHRIRALLLAGIRAAILWRQLGGRRWHILFARRALLEAARAYLSAIPDVRV